MSLFKSISLTHKTDEEMQQDFKQLCNRLSKGHQVLTFSSVRICTSLSDKINLQVIFFTYKLGPQNLGNKSFQKAVALLLWLISSEVYDILRFLFKFWVRVHYQKCFFECGTKPVTDRLTENGQKFYMPKSDQ